VKFGSKGKRRGELWGMRASKLACDRVHTLAAGWGAWVIAALEVFLPTEVGTSQMARRRVNRLPRTKGGEIRGKEKCRVSFEKEKNWWQCRCNRKRLNIRRSRIVGGIRRGGAHFGKRGRGPNSIPKF